MRTPCSYTRYYVVLLAVLLCYSPAAPGQDVRYQRFQYHREQWSVFRHKLFSVYFPSAASDSLYRFVARETPIVLEQIRHATLKEPPKNPNIIIYPSVTTHYESNIGSFETGEVTFPTFLHKGNRVVLAYNGSYEDLRHQLAEGLCRSLWEAQMGDAASKDEQPTIGKKKQEEDIPFWFSEGIIRYFAHGWTVDAEDRNRAAFRNNEFTSWQQVCHYQPRLSGQAFCYFINRNYYPQAIAQTFFQLKKKKSISRALRLVVKQEADSLYEACFRFYKERYEMPALLADSSSVTSILLRHRPGIVQQLLYSSDKTTIAYVLLSMGNREVHLYYPADSTDKKIAVYKLPPWIDEHSSDQYPLLRWKEDNSQLFVAMPHKRYMQIGRYARDGTLLERTLQKGVDGITSFLPLSDREYVQAAYIGGQSDIVKYDDNHEKYTPITDDEYDDSNPVPFIRSGRQEFIFESSRPLQYTKQKTYLIGVGFKKDTLWQGLYSTSDTAIVPVVADTVSFIKWSNPVLVSDHTLLATTTRNGYRQDVLIDTENGSLSELRLHKHFQFMPGVKEIITYTNTSTETKVTSSPLQKWIASNSPSDTNNHQWLTDHLAALAAQAHEDSLLNKGKDTTHYFMDDVFKVQKDTVIVKGKKKRIVARSLTDPYVLQLHSTYFTARVNNDYFINRYQPYAAYMGQYKFPELGGMTRGGFTDLFENHHFNISYRLPAATPGSDFFVKYENKQKIVDWGFSYFRKVETLQPKQNKNWVDEYGRQYPGNAKVKTHYYELSIYRPLTYDCIVGLQLALRKDRTIFLATEKYSLDFLPLEEAWSINTLSFKLNKLYPTVPGLFKGYKAEIFLDGFKGFDKDEALVFGSSFNFSYHKPLFKYITAVTQLHLGYSGGDLKILYNLGGINNNVTPRTDSSVHFAQTDPYAFQTLITPFRGRLQNSLCGSRYFLLNEDIYFPVFQTLVPLRTPLSFVNNLQLGLLSDVATVGGVQWLWSFGLSARSTLAGYPIRFDLAWPGTFNKKPVLYFSLSL